MHNRIRVNVGTENSKARRLYASRGAKPLNEAWTLWKDARSMVGKYREKCPGDN